MRMARPLRSRPDVGVGERASGRRSRPAVFTGALIGALVASGVADVAHQGAGAAAGAAPGLAACPPAPSQQKAEAPSDLVAALTEGVRSAELAGDQVGVSMWIDGLGEVFAANADQQLRPASNEKLITALGVLQILGADTRLQTTVMRSGPVQGGVLQGDLVLIGGGDPLLDMASFANLAKGVKAAGVSRVAGRLVYDDFRYDDMFSQPGWSAVAVPFDIGPVSALSVARNQYRKDREFTVRPAWSNTALFRLLLAQQGIRVDGPTRREDRDMDTMAVVAKQPSQTVGSLVQHMLLFSDNVVAESLVKEVGYRRTGKGTTAAGLAAIAQLHGSLCLDATGLMADGSGLSVRNVRSARQWRTLLQAVRDQDWAKPFVNGLPVAGRGGTLATRFVGTPAQDRVRAKTGTIYNTRSLSGYATTASGRRAVFSIIVNGPNINQANDAIDDLVVALVTKG
jgi:D-alanyl-D-alanine carboxypeptidase/D-alanyl-D-alanine-endopeptidase (penicillin-binding protein 4)